MIYVLIHGGQHGGWCWEQVVPLLQAAGHTVFAPDLPGAGLDNTPPQEVTLEITANFVANLVRNQPEPVVLVGHSMGGITISEAAERAPKRLLGLVYVAAILAADGMSMAQTCASSMEQMNTGVIVSDDGLTTTFDPAEATGVFYNMTEPGLAQQAMARLTPQSTQPIFQPVAVTPGRFGLVPRAYVETLADHMLPIGLQRTMRAGLPCEPVVTMDCDHSPFFSEPAALAAHLITVGEHFEAFAQTVRNAPPGR